MVQIVDQSFWPYNSSHKLRWKSKGVCMLPETSKKCPLCACIIDSDEEVTNCPRCESTYHTDCWSYLGDCAILGCQEEKTQAIELEVSSAKLNKWALLHRAHTTSLLLFGGGLTASMLLYTMQIFLLLIPFGLIPSITVGMIGSSILFWLRAIFGAFCGLGLLGLLACRIPFQRSLEEMKDCASIPIVDRMARLPFANLFVLACSCFSALLWASMLVNLVILLLSFVKGNFYHIGALINLALLLIVHFIVLPYYRKTLTTPQLPERLIKLIKCRSS